MKTLKQILGIPETWKSIENIENTINKESRDKLKKYFYDFEQVELIINDSENELRIKENHNNLILSGREALDNIYSLYDFFKKSSFGDRGFYYDVSRNRGHDRTPIKVTDKFNKIKIKSLRNKEELKNTATLIFGTNRYYTFSESPVKIGKEESVFIYMLAKDKKTK